MSRDQKTISGVIERLNQVQELITHVHHEITSDWYYRAVSRLGYAIEALELIQLEHAEALSDKGVQRILDSISPGELLEVALDHELDNPSANPALAPRLIALVRQHPDLLLEAKVLGPWLEPTPWQPSQSGSRPFERRSLGANLPTLVAWPSGPSGTYNAVSWRWNWHRSFAHTTAQGPFTREEALRRADEAAVAEGWALCSTPAIQKS